MSAPDASGFMPISSAPRDGTTIVVSDPDGGTYVMRWNPKGTNGIVQPDVEGIWEDPHGNFTWSEERGFGPTLWKHLA